MSEIAAAVATIFSSNTTINALLLIADALIYFRRTRRLVFAPATASASAPFSVLSA
jgi:hypothetical protein